MSTKKRERLEVIYDILKAIMDQGNSIKPTRLLYASNLSPQMFKDYVNELVKKKFIEEEIIKKKKTFKLTTKGMQFIAEYKVITEFIGNFGL